MMEQTTKTKAKERAEYNRINNNGASALARKKQRETAAAESAGGHTKEQVRANRAESTPCCESAVGASALWKAQYPFVMFFGIGQCVRDAITLATMYEQLTTSRA